MYEFVVSMIIIFGLVFVFKSIKNIPTGYLGLRERFQDFQETLNPGLRFIIPFFDIVRIVDIREQVITVPEQQIITKDNVAVTVDAIVYSQITDAYKATYEISNVFMAVVNLAQTNLRSVLGTMELNDTLSNRDGINAKLLESLDRETAKWGIKVMRIEIKKLEPPHDVQAQMNMIKNAQSEKTARITEAEGYKISMITKAEADKQSKILQSEGERQMQILQAEGKAQATIAIAEADAKALELQSNAAQEYFKGQAVVKEQLSVIQNSLGGGNTKYILDSDILTSISKTFGIK